MNKKNTSKEGQLVITERERGGRPVATSTDHDDEIREIAELLIAQHGERAASYAIYQSLKAGRRGDRRVMEAWRSIAAVAERVWKVEPVERDE